MTLTYDCSRTALYSPEKRETLFDVVTDPSDVQLAVEAARLAYVRVEESNEQYDRLALALTRAGFSIVTPFFHSGTGGQGFGAMRGTQALLAFRGTQPDSIGDLATDANTVFENWTLGCGQVHAGFAHTALGLWPAVSNWLNGQAQARTQLTICGHSLGAAIATLLAKPALATRIITIGSPRVGDDTFVNDVLASNSLTSTRIVNCCDIVTQIPPEGPYPFRFRHVSEEVYINREGVVLSYPTTAEIEADRATARASYVLEHAFRLGTVLTRDLADHAPINYARAFWP